MPQCVCARSPLVRKKWIWTKTQSFDFKNCQGHCDGAGERGARRGASQAGAPCGEPAGGGGQLLRNWQKQVLTKKIAIIIIIYRFGDFSQRPLCSWTRLTQKCDNSSPPSQNMRSIHNVKIRSVPSPLCSTLLSSSTCFHLLRKSHQWVDVFWSGKSWLGGRGGRCGYYFIGGGTGICSRAQTKVILVLNVGLILMKMTTARRGLTCFAKSMIKYLSNICMKIGMRISSLK